MFGGGSDEVDPTLHLPHILCLHGGGTKARIFRAQCRALTAHLQTKFRLCFADAPFLSQADPDVDEVADVEPWSQGSPLVDIKRLALYWESGFDWRSVEAKLNEIPQYIAKIEVDGYDTYNVHFIHQPSAVKNAIPLLFVHGWPGSFIEVTKILPELIKGGKDFPAFHVVAPSLIDFGFSSASKKVSVGHQINRQTLTVT
jgi:pimeloyl-ACP methyl ester carboxylesterase